MTKSFSQIVQLARLLSEQAPDFLESGTPVHVSRAPGRLDLMGGIADYSGSLVFEWPLDLAVAAAVQATGDDTFHCLSRPPGQESFLEARFSLSDLLDIENVPDEMRAYEKIRDRFKKDPETEWAAYVLGAVSVLARQKGLNPSHGLRIALYSDVPVGSGVSSSAAMEIASIYAIASIYGIDMLGDEAAVLGQKVENLVVGAPCGIMDQMTSAYGEAFKALPIVCRPYKRQTPVRLPRGAEFWGITSGERHAVGGSDYSGVRIGAFMGYRIIASILGLDVIERADGKVCVSDPLYNGYLAEISPSEFEACYRGSLPERMTGEAFLREYEGITDPVTRVDPSAEYAVLSPTAHPIYENHRTRLFARLMALSDGMEENLLLAGELMYQSHASYGACGLGSPGTDRIVRMVRDAGPEAGLYGAKITGGGSGGTVAILGKPEARAEVERIAREYAEIAGHGGLVISGSSGGAASTGVKVTDKAAFLSLSKTTPDLS